MSSTPASDRRASYKRTFRDGAVPALAFGLIHGLIGAVKHRARCFPRMKGRDTAGDGNRDGFRTMVEIADLDVLAKPFRNLRRLFEIGLRQDQNELLSAEAGEKIAAT